MMPEIKKMLLKNAKLILPQSEIGQTAILIDQKRIEKIIDADEILDDFQTINLDILTLFPGFIDIHNHGAVGVDVNTASADDLYKVSKFLASRGVTAWLPTLVPDADENYMKVIAAIEELMETQNE